MNKITKIAAICVVFLSTSLSAFSQEAIQPSDKNVAVSEVKAAPESTEIVKPKAEETKNVPAKRQSSDTENWKGFYIGGNVGGTVSKNSLVTTALDCGGLNGINNAAGQPTTTNGCIFSPAFITGFNAIGNQETKPKGFTGGVQAGYNFQSGNFVGGVEADFNSFRQNKTVSALTASGATRNDQTLKTVWLMTLRPRAGFTAGKALIYGTGGLAVTNINYQNSLTTIFNISCATPNTLCYTRANTNLPIKQTKAGWTAGAGAEFKVSDNWSVKGEYLYTQFKTSGRAVVDGVVLNVNSTGAITATTNISTPNSFLNSDVKLQSHHFRFGVNYRF